ncbi:kinetochore-associated 1 isoform X1 [Labeo rohita]|uniref:Kinetochore-associated 1 isoform X1 n=1 Tax=Labeo rohita TaxID=84645 RepID=A0A498LQH0_LABRO|nr:kinetochore-associated 1 isoform X1 [Labeo rohita]
MWNNVELLLNEDTNTVRLSGDAEQESGNALYQVDTLVKLSSSEKVSGLVDVSTEVLSNPRVSASSTPSCCVVVADTAVVLFDPGFQTVLIHLYFDTVVDAVTACPQGQFLLVGERNGSLHIIYVPLKKTVLTKTLHKRNPSDGDEATFKSLILHETPGAKGVYDLFFIVNDGFLHTSNVALGKIQRAIENMDLAALNQIQDDILMNFCSTKEIHEDGCNSAGLVCFGSTVHLLIGAVGANVLSLWTMGSGQKSLSLAKLLDSALVSEVKKIQVVDNLVYVLNKEGMLSLLDIHSFVMLCCWPDQYVVDFLLISDGNSSSITQQVSHFDLFLPDENNMKILSLVAEENKGHARKLVFQSLPSMEVFYSLEVSSESWLIQKGISMDTIYLLEGILANAKSPEDPVSTVVIRCFTEALPENRLNRLLYKHKFEEAEKFAKAFGLDVELVYKVKLNVVLEKLISASGADQTLEWPELIEEAKSNLMKIMDEQFVVQYCLTASWPTLSIAEEMLNYTLNRFPCCQVQTALAKLATFSNVYGPDNFEGIAWIEFLNSTDYLKDILALLKEGNLTGAQYLWLRHEGEFASEFDESCLHALLGSISSDVPSQELSVWFKGVVVPFVWRVLPTGQAENCGSEEVQNLRSLVANLRQLCDLYSKYSCHLSLSDYERGSTRSMAFLMLDKVQAPELIPAVIKSSIQPYALENGLDLDQTLLQYIKDLLDCCSSQITSLFTEWEAKAVAVLHCMTDTNKVMDAVIEIMYKAVVPWSDTIEKLVQQHLEKEHPKQELLREGYRLMEIKKLLRCYGIRSLALSNTRDIMMLVRHILKQDLPSSLEDSLKLIEAYKLNPAEIHHLHCIHLIQHNKREKCVGLLKNLPHSEAEFVIERLVCWARLELQDKQHISEEQKKLQMLISQIMVEALKYLQSIQTDDAFKKTESENNLMMFTAIAHLQEDFDIFLTPEEYEDPVVRRKFNQQLITAYENARAWRRSGKQHPDEVSGAQLNGGAAVANDPDGKTKTLSTEAGLHRLARQLQKTEQELWADLALRALDAGDVEKALQILRELYQHHSNCSTGQVLFSTAQRLCQMLEENVPMVLPEKMNLPAVIHGLACQAITVCHSDLLLDCLELCKSTRSAADVYRQCQIEDFGFFAKESALSGEEDAYTESHFQDVFNEDCIVLDPVSVLPLQYKITRNLLPLSDADLVGPLLNPLASMLQMLQECSQLELALRLLKESYGSILTHFVSNNMDLFLSVRLHSNNRMVRDKQTLDRIEKTVLSSVGVVVVSLLQKVLNWRVVDSDLAIGLCTILPKAAVVDILWKMITSAWQNYEKIKVVAMVGAHLSFLYKDEEERAKFLSVITDAEWGIQLGKLGVSIHTFGLDSGSAINLYITTLLLQEDRWYETEIGEGDADAPMRCEESLLGEDDMLESALQIVPQLGSTKDLVISLNTALTKLNPYNYERIERVLRTIQMADETTTLLPLGQMVGLLQHLKSHRRISPPTDLESSYVLENGLEPSALANTRLPFHLLFQTNHTFWKIVSPELSEDTLPTLLLICKLMKVNPDKLYVLAVNHVFKKTLLPLLTDQSKKIQNVPASKELSSVAQSIFKHALCIQNLELAAATVHKIAQDLPAVAVMGILVDRTVCIFEQESLQARGEALISKLQLQYQRSATENALLSSQLSSPELLKLTGLPGRLIVALFEHGSVLDRMKNPAGLTYPDIHSVAKDIASINGVDLLKIRNILLEKWLCQSGQSNGKDNHQDYVTDINDDPDLMRVVYLLQMHPMDISARLLSPILTAQTWPLGGSGLRLTFEHRSRALLCLTHLADAATLETLSNQPSSKIRYYLKCYMYLAQMEALNIPYTLEMFISSPKEGMIKGLWKNHNNEPQAVRLVAELCLEYEVYDLQLWNSVLQKLMSFNMTSYLQKVLEALIAVPSLLESFLLSCNPTLILDQVEESMSTGELAGIPSQIRDTVFTFLCRNGKSRMLMKTKHFTYLKRHLISKGHSEMVQELLNCFVEQNG